MWLLSFVNAVENVQLRGLPLWLPLYSYCLTEWEPAAAEDDNNRDDILFNNHG